MLKYSTLTPRSRLFTSFVFCFIAGSFSSLAMAPTNIWLLLFIGISVLYYAVAHLKSSWSAFFNGWFFGFGYFLFGLSWIGNALLVEGSFNWLAAIRSPENRLHRHEVSLCYQGEEVKSLIAEVLDEMEKMDTIKGK